MKQKINRIKPKDLKIIEKINKRLNNNPKIIQSPKLEKCQYQKEIRKFTKILSTLKSKQWFKDDVEYILPRVNVKFSQHLSCNVLIDSGSLIIMLYLWKCMHC